MSSRNKKRLDYRELHSTGQVSYIAHTSSDENLSSRLDNLSIQDDPADTMLTDQSIVEITLLVEWLNLRKCHQWKASC